MELIEAVKCRNMGAVERLLQEGGDVNQMGADGWNPLNWAAAGGDIPLAKLLLRFGASVSSMGKDQRTPAMIALAAGKPEIARFLQDATSKSETAHGTPERRYCMAFRLSELREFPAWADSAANAADDTNLPGTSIVYLHSNYRVTRSVWLDGEALFDNVTPAWMQFCQTRLKFGVPNDLDLLAV
jgi:ankyrin repeat protein